MFLPAHDSAFFVCDLEIQPELTNHHFHIDQRSYFLQEAMQVLDELEEVSLQFVKVAHFDWQRHRLKPVEILQKPQVVSELLLLFQIETPKHVEILKVEHVHVHILAFGLF